MTFNLPNVLAKGAAAPLGATIISSFNQNGAVAAHSINFAVFSDHSQRIELCIFDASGTQELRRYDLHGPDDGVFHGELPGADAGLVYGYRAYGEYAPQLGHRFNPNKLLLDPYAREVLGHFNWHDSQFDADQQDSAAYTLKSRVAPQAEPIRWQRPQIAAADMVLYEVHVKGLSMQLPGLPEHLRGTFSALAHPLAIAHFKRIGVTSLSLLPVQYCLSERALAQRNRSNYWGYNTLAFFSPDPRFGSQQADPTALIKEFKTMVQDLHSAGLEVVLDVVFNHTAEGDQLGPSVCFRGLDNLSWYRAMPDELSRCENFSGCGNTLNISHPKVTQFVLDCLRYWVEIMGVDGFRFDLASVLGRPSASQGFDPNAAFFIALRQDPVLAKARLISEPWDCGPNGYQLGRFPGRFIEWNDRFRDAMRRYWMGFQVTRGEFARRFCASSDFFHHANRKPSASVNFISAHDGFTLSDALSYSGKHNFANGEHNQDGRHDELCNNFGIEGATDDATINATRLRVRHALLATLLLAQGTPMLLAGDEVANSQFGNNNAYCQDNETAWLDWNFEHETTLKLVQSLMTLRKNHALLRHPDWFSANQQQPARARVLWRTPEGSVMQIEDWHHVSERALMCEFYAPNDVRASLAILFNPLLQSSVFKLAEQGWHVTFDSANELALASKQDFSVYAPARSLVLLHRLHASPTQQPEI
jgi:isoamylase